MKGRPDINTEAGPLSDDWYFGRNDKSTKKEIDVMNTDIAELRRLEAEARGDNPLKRAKARIAVIDMLPELLKALEWQPIETAPHGVNVLLAWEEEDQTLSGGWIMEAGMASWGWRRDGVSNMSAHGQATYWRPLPNPPHGGVDVQK